jgi:AcrR family transcriptional regulator
MEQTRQRLLEHAMLLLGDPTATEVTVAEAATRAGVSVRTAYRYFPTKDALLDDLNLWMGSRSISAPRYPERFVEVYDMVAALYAWFHEREDLVRASMRLPHAQEVRTRRKRQQVRAVTKLVAAEAPWLGPVELKRVGGAVHVLVSADNYFYLRDFWELSPEEAIQSAQWGLEAIAARLRKRKG